LFQKPPVILKIIPKADKGFDICKFAIIYQALDKDKYAFKKIIAPFCEIQHGVLWALHAQHF
jgi:hypothetical protein